MNRTHIHLSARAGASFTKACVCLGGQMRPDSRWSKQQTTGPGFPA